MCHSIRLSTQSLHRSTNSLSQNFITILRITSRTKELQPCRWLKWAKKPCNLQALPLKVVSWMCQSRCTSNMQVWVSTTLTKCRLIQTWAWDNHATVPASAIRFRVKWSQIATNCLQISQDSPVKERWMLPLLVGVSNKSLEDRMRMATMRKWNQFSILKTTSRYSQCLSSFTRALKTI